MFPALQDLDAGFTTKGRLKIQNGRTFKIHVIPNFFNY